MVRYDHRKGNNDRPMAGKETKMKNYYEIRFDTYKNGLAVLYGLHLEASNMKEAKRMAESMWYEDKKDPRHMFHMTVKRLPETEEFQWHWFHALKSRSYSRNLCPYLNQRD